MIRVRGMVCKMVLIRFLASSKVPEYRKGSMKCEGSVPGAEATQLGDFGQGGIGVICKNFPEKFRSLGTYRLAQVFGYASEDFLREEGLETSWNGPNPGNVVCR